MKEYSFNYSAIKVIVLVINSHCFAEMINDTTPLWPSAARRYQEEKKPPPSLWRSLQRKRKQLTVTLNKRPLAPLINCTLTEIALVVAFLAFNAVYICLPTLWLLDAGMVSVHMGDLIQWDLMVVFLFATRNSVWDWIFGYSFERSIWFHRITGAMVCPYFTL